ncbi:hypothetical protein [Neisseria musculi]|uniref:Uncharacterized protein n=1 Tax=Neisseria musculi TaxID=1815583 RepID=A0A7H1MDY9_9NEIS|nr:hypothetical protein [Neisseria musculi]QNT59854.1 hypothetical protein H7A79_2152 [Neisseria musculi]
MNLYKNIDSYSGFVGWNTASNIFDTFSPNEWQPVSTPKASDYVPLPTPAAPSATDYIRTQPYPESSVTKLSTLDTLPVMETTLGGGKRYSVEELQQIGSKSREEIIEFFKNIGGTATETIEEGRVFTSYSSPLLPGKSISLNDKGDLFWITSYAKSPEDIYIIGSKTTTLTDSEIVAIINAQNNLSPQAEDYVSVETAFATENSNTEIPTNLPTETATVLRPDIAPVSPITPNYLQPCL